MNLKNTIYRIFEILFTTITLTNNNLIKVHVHHLYNITWNPVVVMSKTILLHMICNINLEVRNLRNSPYCLNLLRVLLLSTMTMKFPLLGNWSTTNGVNIGRRELKPLFPWKLWEWILVMEMVLSLVVPNMLLFLLINVQQSSLFMGCMVPLVLMCEWHSGNSSLTLAVFHIISNVISTLD